MAANIPLIDAQGNINLHVRSDLTIDIKPGPTLGTLAGRPLSFEIPRHNVRYDLIVHPLDPTWQLINIPMARLAAVRTGDPFVLIDRSGGGYKVWWEGVVQRRGQ